MAQPRFSVIVPAYNEELYLPRLLDSIDIARDGFIGRGDAIEVIVADNLSTDLTANVADSRGCKVARVVRRTIASARNGGAAIASGKVLCFIDADSAIHPETFNAVDAAMKDDRFVAGSTGIYLERRSLGTILTYCLLVPVAWLTGMDTGLVFCRRPDFDAVGGFDEELLYAEDVKFQWKLLQMGRRRGQRLTRLTNVRALGSTRKFDQFGDWHYFPMALRGLIGVIFGGNRETAEKYWYKPER